MQKDFFLLGCVAIAIIVIMTMYLDHNKHPLNKAEALNLAFESCLDYRSKQTIFRLEEKDFNYCVKKARELHQ